MLEDIEKYDFARRCKRLERILSDYSDFEESPRVWASVIIELLKKITDAEPDPDACRNQIVETLYRKDQ
jgi:hypothetical protein